MEHTINFHIPSIAAFASAVAVNTTTETDLAKVLPASTNNDLDKIRKSQLSVYIDFALGSATEIDIRYYYTPDGTNWYQIPIKNQSTGALANTPSVLNSGSPAKVVEDITFSGSAGFKVTGKSVGAAATINNIYIFIRDN